MHSKKKGNVGQLATGLCLAKMGYSIFTEEGDISPIDLIAEKNGRLLRFQCKGVSPVKGRLEVRLVKSGPGYTFKYTEDLFDYFSVYDLHGGGVYLLPSKVLNECGRTVSLRLEQSKNNQTKNVRLAADHTPDKIL